MPFERDYGGDFDFIIKISWNHPYVRNFNCKLCISVISLINFEMSELFFEVFSNVMGPNEFFINNLR